MATLWETVTGNSTLPIQAGNTFYDHLLNQAGGGGGPTQLVVIEAIHETNEVEFDVIVDPLSFVVEVEEYEAILEDEVTVDIEIDRTEIIQ